MANPIKRFAFPAENDEYEEINLEERLTNKLRDTRQGPVSEFSSPLNTQPRTTVSYDYDQKPPVNPPKNMFNTDIFNPNTYEDAQRIAEEILGGNSAIVNLEHLLNDEVRKQDAIRIIDFLCGVAYAIKIDVKRVNAATFLFTMK